MSGTVQRSEGAGGPPAQDTTERFGSCFKRTLLDARHEYELDVGGGHPLQDSLAAGTAGVPAAGGAPPATPVRSSLSAEQIDTSISRLDDMRRRGLIADAEFEDKKREILDRL